MIQINTVHVEAGTDLFDLPFVARQLIVEYLKKIHKCLAKTTENYVIKSCPLFLPGLVCVFSKSGIKMTAIKKHFVPLPV